MIFIVSPGLCDAYRERNGYTSKEEAKGETLEAQESLWGGQKQKLDENAGGEGQPEESDMQLWMGSESLDNIPKKPLNLLASPIVQLS